MTTLHPHHGAILSELRSLGFTTATRPATDGRTHVASMRHNGHFLIALPPTANDPGALLDTDRGKRLLSANWDVPAACFSDVIRDHLTGAEVARMHGPDCRCVHPDAL